MVTMKGNPSCEARETNPAPSGDDESSQGREEQRNPVPRQQRRPGGATERFYRTGWSLWQQHGGGSPVGLPGCFLLLGLRVEKSSVRCGQVLLGEWDPRCSSPSPKRSSGVQGADALAGHSCVVERHGVLRPPTRRGQSVARPRWRTGGHDMKRPRVWWCPERVTPPRWPSSGSVRPGGRRRRG